MAKNEVLTIDDVLEAAREYLSEEDIGFIDQAYRYARDAHKEQYRKSGEPYILHPIQVAGILVGLKMDPMTVAAGFLHDVVEDTEITLEDIEQEFNYEVAMLVDGVTKLGKIKYKSKEEQQAENHRKMFVAMAQDIRVILIKLADRLHNMRTLQHLPPEKQRRISNETLEIFAPLAHRLGISTIKWELEDTALRYLKPQQYYRIVNLMQRKRAEREKDIKEVIGEITTRLDEVNIAAEIYGRPKHIYSIYRKMVIQNKQFDEIYDLLAVRVIVKSIKDCYAVLGIIHTCWKPMPGRFKDYIAMPKANMYQSLHTTVIGPKGEPLEVQIRTKEMHSIAEYGIAAHWAYKEGRTSNQSFEKKIALFREILEWQNDMVNAEEFIESLKIDLFSDMVFVFTPKGDVIELPKGSVPIDFAYRIHSEIGNKCIGAKVNGRIVPLDYELKTGEIVEVLTSKHSYGPSQDWLKLAQSSQAKSKIRQFFKRQRRDENIEKGRELIEKELKVQNYDTKELMIDEKLMEVAKKFNFTNLDDMLVAVGFNGLTAKQVVTRLTDRVKPKEQDAKELLEQVTQEQDKQSRRKKKPTIGVKVKGIDNLLIRMARCCNPVPGDDIIGFITKGRGVSIHRTDCPNVQEESMKERLLEVEWENNENSSKVYDVDIEIMGYDRRGLLNEVLQVVYDTKTHLSSVSGKSDRDKVVQIHMTIAIQNISHLHKVVAKIKQIPDVYSVRRIMQ